MESSLQLPNSTAINIPNIMNIEWQLKFLFVINTVISPSISVIGVGGNILSNIVLFQHGLEKSSYVLLFALSIADTSYSVGMINIPNFIYTSKTPYGFYFSQSVSLFMHVWGSIQNFLTFAGQCSALTIPMLITAERLVTVFCPFKLTQIFTSRRTAIAVSILMTFWSLYAIYIVSFVFLEEKTISLLNITIFQKNDELLYTEIPVYINTTALHLQGSVPVSFVTLGCFIVGIKTKLITSKRSKMTSGFSASSARTTRILLAVCTVYVIADGYGVIYPYIVQMRPDLMLVLNAFAGLLLCLNSSWNFIIYVIMNKTLRVKYISLIFKILCLSPGDKTTKMKYYFDCQ